MEWKEEYEKKHKCFFRKDVGKTTTKEGTMYRYVCNRSGIYKANGKGMRNLKVRGTIKIGGFCPAKMTILEKDSNVVVSLRPTHVGHGEDLRSLHLSKKERESIAIQLQSGIQMNKILSDIRNSLNGNFNRIHLINKQDLYNICKEFQITDEFTHKYHDSDVVSVECWVNELQESAIFYKKQNSPHPILEEKDFCLIIMTQFQEKTLKRYGSNIICMDSTHGLNSYDFQLTSTIMILDNLNQGIPCCFMFSNKTDETVIKILFEQLISRIGFLKCKVFMSDMANSFYNGYTSICSRPDYRLFCSWHVTKAWKNNLSKIKTDQKKIRTFKIIKTLMMELKKDSFDQYLPIVIEELVNNPETKNFGLYFNQMYGGNFESWAYSYRIDAKINTNNHLESMHKCIKHVYLKSKHVRRLDIAIGILMTFIRDKAFDHIISMEKGKITAKLSAIRLNHKKSEMVDKYVITETSTGFNYCRQQSEFIITKLKDNCDCDLRCLKCKICLHMYTCTCIDCSIKYNMCIHIHLACTQYNGKLQHVHKIDNLVYNDNNDEHQYAQPLKNINLDKEILNPNSVNQEKENLKEEFLEILALMNSNDDVEIVKKYLKSMKITLLANMQNSNKQFETSAGKPLNCKRLIEKQNRFYSTKRRIPVKDIPVNQAEREEILEALALASSSRV